MVLQSLDNVHQKPIETIKAAANLFQALVIASGRINGALKNLAKPYRPCSSGRFGSCWFGGVLATM